MKTFLLIAFLLAAVAAENFIIEVKDKVDEKLNHALLEKLPKGERRQAVYDFLNKNSKVSQENLISFLEENKLNIKPFWITNRIWVEDMPLELIDALNERSDVIAVRKEQYAHIIEHEYVSVSQEQKASRNDWNLEIIRATEAWEITQGEGITVGVVDTGSLYTHEALVGSYRGNTGSGFSHDYNFFDPRQNAVEPEDGLTGHGSHCTGSIAGTMGSGIGVAPGAKWIAAKGCANILCTERDLMESGQFMACPTRMNGTDPDCSLGPDVVSNSWGGGEGNDFYKPVVEAWRAAGMIPIFAQGNSGPSCGSANSPGDYDNVIGVGATDDNNTLALFSSRGPGVGGAGFSVLKPDISGPGVQIRSASGSDNNEYVYLSGTSMACPHISGVVALMLSANPSMSYDQVYSILTSTAQTDLPAPAVNTECGGVEYTEIPSNHYGYGVADAYEAVTQAKKLMN